MDTGTVRLQRKIWTGRGEAFEYVVLVDGKKVGTVRNGATVDFNINAGHHELQLKIPWGGGFSHPVTFALAPGMIFNFECEPYFLENAGALFDRKRPVIQLRMAGSPGDVSG